MLATLIVESLLLKVHKNSCGDGEELFIFLLFFVFWPRVHATPQYGLSVGTCHSLSLFSVFGVLTMLVHSIRVYTLHNMMINNSSTYIQLCVCSAVVTSQPVSEDEPFMFGICRDHYNC